MQVFLLAISALVVGAFFTVWTIQRAGDVAVLRALGASTRYLLRDAIGQAGVVLGVGVGVGTALAAGAGLLASASCRSSSTSRRPSCPPSSSSCSAASVGSSP